ncbi:MAG: TFIIB-type zinc ribbon-containing protein [Candidatus Kariarchaeaceae archaeon]
MGQRRQGNSKEKWHRQRCSDCLSTVMVYDTRRGELTCDTCGLVLQERMVTEDMRDNYSQIFSNSQQ